MLVPCLAYSSTLKMEAIITSKLWLTFEALQGIISQKIELIREVPLLNQAPGHDDLWGRGVVEYES
jgi:hypothetical protein